MTEPDVVRRHVLVTGRVQGVGFRAGVQRQAEEQGLAGWVRNLPDGSVEAELEGPGPAFERVLGWLRTGPRSAVVEDVAVTSVEPTGEPGVRVR